MGSRLDGERSSIREHILVLFLPRLPHRPICSFYLPGCLIGGYLLDRLGRRYTQMSGFFVQGVIGMILGGALGPIQSKLPAFIVVYGECDAIALYHEACPSIFNFISPLLSLTRSLDPFQEYS